MSRAVQYVAKSLACMFACLTAAGLEANDVPSAMKASGGVSITLSPLLGVNRDTVTTGAPVGPSKLADTRPEYGLYANLRAPHVRVSDFLFYTDPNDAQVFGNFLSANFYLSDTARWTVNAGVGHLYHWIGMERGNVVVSAPLVKAGPVLRIPEVGLTLNPFVGFVWEQIASPYGDSRNDEPLYGLGLNWHWRMLGANATYYVQVGKEDREDLHTLRAYVHAALGANWGWILRFDYMEHTTTDDTSVLTGPTFIF